MKAMKTLLKLFTMRILKLSLWLCRKNLILTDHHGKCLDVCKDMMDTINIVTKLWGWIWAYLNFLKKLLKEFYLVRINEMLSNDNIILPITNSSIIDDVSFSIDRYYIYGFRNFEVEWLFFIKWYKARYLYLRWPFF